MNELQNTNYKIRKKYVKAEIWLTASLSHAESKKKV